VVLLDGLTNLCPHFDYSTFCFASALICIWRVCALWKPFSLNCIFCMHPTTSIAQIWMSQADLSSCKFPLPSCMYWCLCLCFPLLLCFTYHTKTFRASSCAYPSRWWNEWNEGKGWHEVKFSFLTMGPLSNDWNVFECILYWCLGCSLEVVSGCLTSKISHLLFPNLTHKIEIDCKRWDTITSN